MSRRPVRRILPLVVLMTVLATSCGPKEAPHSDPVRRVLVYSMPGVTWDEVQRSDLPNFKRLVARSAIGDISTRIGREPATTTAAYLTLGAGTRAVVPGIDTGVALNPDEPHGGIPASELLRRRLGKTVEGIAYIPVGATIDANATSPFGAVPGTLGDALQDAGVRRAVIANADAAEGFPTDQPPPDGAYARSAATALMGSDGVVPGGSVGRLSLLVDDPAAPFGRRLDPNAVVDTFDEQWDQSGRAVVLVEASDLARATAYASRSTPQQARRLRAEALQDADHLLGRLLDRVNPKTDAVLVVSPVSRTSLGVATMQTPDVHQGLLTSASTRRAGYVYLADVAPTVLDLLGEKPPTSIEGRPFDVIEATGNRVAHLAEQSADAATRDERLPLVVPLVIAALAALALAVWRRDRLPRRAQALLRPLAIGALGLVPGTFLAGQIPATRTSDLAYFAVVLAVGAVVGIIGGLVDRRWPGIGPLIGVGSVLAVIGIDLLIGAPLQVNSVFGYSMAVAGRFTGLGNLAFALFASAAVCFAVLAFDRFGRAALPWIGGVLVAAVLLDGLPMLGADVGGVISVVPAFALTVLALLGRRIGWRQLVACVIGAVLVVGAFGVLDSSRPAGSKTHLARIGEHVTHGRLDLVVTTLWRRVHASFGADEAIIWLLAIAVMVIALAQATAVARGLVGPGAQRKPRPPGTTALWVGLGTVALLGLVANDSSIAVPATMLIVVVPVIILRETAHDGETVEPPAEPAPEPADPAPALQGALP